MGADDGTIIAGFSAEKFDIVKHCTSKFLGYNAGTMDDFNPTQLITLCAVFIGFHLLALPFFIWGMRRRQFAGREQKEWNLDSFAAPDAPVDPLKPAPLTPKARIMLGILGVFATGMLASVLLVLYVAMHATAHAATGKSPF